MYGDWPLADDINAQLDALVIISEMTACLHDGKAHLYSGPIYKVFQRILGPKMTNHERGIVRARKSGAVLIEDTLLGDFLRTFRGIGIYKYFKTHPHLTLLEKRKEARKVWDHASYLFIKALWGKVSTSVCGADRTAVFCDTELRTMADPGFTVSPLAALVARILNPYDKKIETVNGISARKIRQVFSPHDIEPVMRFVCQAELGQTLKQAWKLGSAEVFGDFLNCFEMHYAGLSLLMGRTASPKRPMYGRTPHEWQAWKQEQLRRFVTMRLGRAFTHDDIEKCLHPILPATDYRRGVAAFHHQDLVHALAFLGGKHPLRWPFDGFYWQVLVEPGRVLLALKDDRLAVVLKVARIRWFRRYDPSIITL